MISSAIVFAGASILSIQNGDGAVLGGILALVMLILFAMEWIRSLRAGS